jgi:hypothetical protein
MEPIKGSKDGLGLGQRDGGVQEHGLDACGMESAALSKLTQVVAVLDEQIREGQFLARFLLL